MTPGARPLPRLAFGPAAITAGERTLPEEVGVALSFNGSTQAVMMATPADLEEFATGFALTEGIASPAEIEGIEVVEVPRGLDVQVWLAEGAAARLAARRRSMAGPVGCGLCGIETLEAALRPLPPVAPGGLRMTPAQVMAAVAALPAGQRLHDATRAAHAAGFWSAGRMAALREDVGRHNALDKLAGWALRAGVDPATGAVVLTSRVSVDLVQKVAAMGAGVMIAVSSPTAQAVDLAEALNLTLIAQARPDRFEAYTHTDRLLTESPAHVR
jgi:FdhD protein